MGVEKARLRFPGGTLLALGLARMGEVASPLVVSLADGQAQPPLPAGVLSVRDTVAGQGPLQGLLEGFRRLEGRCERVLVMPVDMPFFTPPWMVRLVDGLARHRACLYEHEGIANALTAAYDMELLPKLAGLVADGRRRPIFLCEDEPTRRIAVPGDALQSPAVPQGGGHPLADVDTPQAYRAALLAAGIGRPGGAEITIAWSGPDAGSELVALHADRADEALGILGRLYPEPFPAGATGAVALSRPRRGGGQEILAGAAALRSGEALRLEPGNLPHAPDGKERR
jgi:molybdopterin-guanine dinucleotide biosynthesis protein A